MKATRKRLDRVVLVLACVLVLALVNGLVARKEHTAATGLDIYLALAPIDPRAILQGDYMTLRFALADELERSKAGTQGALRGQIAYAPISLDERGVAHLSPADSAHSALSLRYRFRGQQVWLGTNAFFFEEGSAKRYESARFGHFKLSRSSGDAVLIGLADESLQPL